MATHNVRMMTVDETHGVGRVLDALSVYARLTSYGAGIIQVQRLGGEGDVTYLFPFWEGTARK